MRQLFLAILITLSISRVFAKDEKVPPEIFMKALSSIMNNLDKTVPKEMIAKISEFKVGEIVHVFLNKALYLAQLSPDFDSNPKQKEEIFALIDALKKSAETSHIVFASKDEAYVFNTLEMIEMIIGEIETKWDMDKEVSVDILNGFKELYMVAKKREGIVRSYRETKNNFEVDINQKSESDKKALTTVEKDEPKLASISLDEEKLKKILDFLNENVVEQPDVIKYIESILRRAMILGYSKRKKPSITYLMGMPGTGKDTSAEAWADAMFGGKGAHAKMEAGVPMLYRLPVMRKHADMWKVLGSAKGYVGSSGAEKITPFIRWLVKFSAGRYKIVEGQEPYIVENPDWKPGMIFEGYYPPEMGVLYVNEFHNWSREAKDLFLKQFLEKGYISLENPGKGVSELYIPINIVIATNEGIGLVSTRELDGRVVGRLKTYAEAKAARDKANSNKDLLKNEILRTNSLDPEGVAHDSRRGISEEVLNRIPPSSMILMNPLSPGGLQKIAKLNLIPLKSMLSESAGIYGSISLDFSEDVYRVIQEYHYNPEANARPIEDNIRTLVENTIFDAIKNGQIQGNNDGKGHGFYVDIEKNGDRTMYLVFKNLDDPNQEFRTLIEATLNDKPVEPISEEQMEELLKLEEKIRETYVGNEAAVTKLVDYIITSERSRNKKRVNMEDHDPARVLMFAGLSSTGKTELGKALAKALNVGGLEDRFTIDFNLMNHETILKEMIYGKTDSRGESIPSPFMQYYDKHNGNFVLYLEEITNAPLPVLAILYDLFREAVLQGFSDKKPRPMSNVTIVATGNVGAEWFSQIPTDIPDEERMMIYGEIYRRSIRDPNFLRQSLVSKFPEPLVNRIQLDNTFFFEPHNFKSVRQLTQNKVVQYLERLKTAEGAGGWDISFESESDFIRLIEAIEDSGFRIAEQGASIDGYINTNIYKAGLHALLVKSRVKFGTQVIIKAKPNTYKRNFRGSLTSNFLPPEDNDIEFDVLTEDGRTLTWKLPRNERKYFAQISDEDKILTAYHEAGHSIVRQILLGDKYMPDLITTVPGVDNFGGQWLRYLGLASNDEKEMVIKTRKAIIQEMAVLFAGEVAQTLVTRSAVHDAGKSNDIERANKLAQKAILEWGLSDVWGRYVVEDPSKLSGEKRKVYDSEMDKWLKEARELARQTLLLNYDSHLVPLATQLAEQGTLFKMDLESFYEANKTRESHPDNTGFWGSLTNKSLNAWKADYAGNLFKSGARDAKLLPHLPRPRTVASTEQFIHDLKQKSIADVQLPKKAPIGGFKKPVQAQVQQPVGGSCSGLFAVGF